MLVKLEASLSPTSLWDDELDSLLVLLVAESFVRVRYRERKTALHRSHVCLHCARVPVRLLVVQLDRKSCACYSSGVGASWTARVDMLPLSVFFMGLVWHALAAVSMVSSTVLPPVSPCSTNQLVALLLAEHYVVTAGYR